MSDFVDGGKFDIVWDGLMEEVVISEEDFANQFGINPSVFNEPFDESTNANVNLNKCHLESLTATKSKTDNSENISKATEITTEDVQKFIEAEDNKTLSGKHWQMSVNFNNILRRKAKRRQSTIYQSTIMMNILSHICSPFARVMVMNTSLSHCVASWEALSGNFKEQTTHTLSFGAVVQNFPSHATAWKQSRKI
ncbi:hypothetical protein DPMN_158463 [Dreissena polymorpha]|uniref:Uncharacterized protein n=1 Tax=Dreissena polymorpha TaxID=45954 RepID=A0A9D4EJV7_DREPO|nr:hypothetical protein DPMN_158463 [Dreissena polymorpha]